MDTPSGVVEHDTVVELREKVERISVCARQALPDLLDQVQAGAEALAYTTSDDPFVRLTRFMATVVAHPSEECVRDAWYVLNRPMPLRLDANDIDEAVEIVLEALKRIIDTSLRTRTRVGSAIDALMCLSELRSAVA